MAVEKEHPTPVAKHVFLSLTDLHYADEQANFTDDPKGLGADFGHTHRDSALENLRELLSQGFKRGELDFIAVVGDITTRGNKAGLDAFYSELYPVLAQLVPAPAICVVPGNHDVRWGLNPHKGGYYNEKFKDFAELIRNMNATSCLLPNGEVSHDESAKLSFFPQGRSPLYIDKAKRLLVLNINSALRCGEVYSDMCTAFESWSGGKLKLLDADGLRLDKKDENISQYVIRDVTQFTPEQGKYLQSMLSVALSEIGDDWNNYLKVALVHHHLVHFEGQVTEHKGYEFMLDSSSLLELLTSFDFDLILTGHKHKEYQLVHHFAEKQIFIVGGPTVGGLPSNGSFRGARLIEVENDGSSKRLIIRNLDESGGRGNVAHSIRSAKRITKEIQFSGEEVSKRYLQSHGHVFREITVTTEITPVGDARRAVVFDGLTLLGQHERQSLHPMELPMTSGYVDTNLFRKLDFGSTFDIVDLVAEKHLPKSASLNLKFRPELPISQDRIKYGLEWTVVNAFALNEQEFRRMHPCGPGEKAPLHNLEFTHFQTHSPTERLTVVAHLPDGFEFVGEPSVRVAIPDPKLEDSRLWELDHEATRRLSKSPSWRFVPSLNLIAFSIKWPNPDRSYRIEWRLPKANKRHNSERIAEVVRKINGKGGCSLQLFANVFAGVKRVFDKLDGFDGPLDISFMVFGTERAPGVLTSFAAMRCKRLDLSNDPASMESLPILTKIPYGLGVAGRSFRANKIQYHASSDVDPDHDSGGRVNSFLNFENSLDHQRLVCIPLHIPASEDEFHERSNYYDTSEPYGIVNIGSEDKDCPLPKGNDDDFLYVEDAANKVKALQHEINEALWGELEQRKTFDKVSRRT